MSSTTQPLAPDTLFRSNCNDILAGLRRHRVWRTAAWLEVKQRYRRSVLGSSWIALNLAVLIGGMGLVFSILFGQDPTTFLPYVGAGMVTWQLIAALINDGCEALINARLHILHYNLPTSVYVFRHLARVAINLAHTSIVMILLVIVMPVDVNLNTWLMIPGLLLVFMNGFWVTIVFGLLSLRYRDLPMLTANFVQVMFFITPIFWNASDLGDKDFIAHVNPFYHFIELVREPLLGRAPAFESYGVGIGLTIVGCALATWVWGRLRHTVPYYL